MKKMMIAGGAAALALTAVLDGVALAQQPPAQRTAARADVDGDGRISQAEFVQARVQRLTAMDTDNDGSVTPEERQAHMAAKRDDRIGARFDRLDTDRNGAISRAEFEVRPERAGRGQSAGKGPRAAVRAERMAARREARGPLVIAEAQAKATETFARLDVNNDGAVTVEERRGARQQMREARQERRVERVARRAAVTAQTPPSPAAPPSE